MFIRIYLIGIEITATGLVKVEDGKKTQHNLKEKNETKETKSKVGL